MARIAGVDIPGNKKVPYALQYIYGIGRTKAWEIVERIGVDPDTKADNLTDQQLAEIRKLFEEVYIVEGALRQELKANIKRLMDFGTYRGLRHRKGLPVRGQRTKTNSRTIRGNVRKTMGSGRKNTSEKT